MERTAGGMVGYARSRTLGKTTPCSGPVRATHPRVRTSVLHPPYVNNPVNAFPESESQRRRLGNRQLFGLARVTTRSPEAHDWAVKAFKSFNSDGQFIPFAVGKQQQPFSLVTTGARNGADRRSTRRRMFCMSTPMRWHGRAGCIPLNMAAALGRRRFPEPVRHVPWS